MKGLGGLLIVILSLCGVIEAANMQNFFTNFDCSSNACFINGISSSDKLQQTINQLTSNLFEFFKDAGSGYCEGYGGQYCIKVRGHFEQYTQITFSNSKFTKFPSGDYSKLNNIKSLKAVDVGLTEINRDDLKSFKSLQSLDLSKNNITTLGSLFLLHVPSLKSLDLSRNEIIKIDPLVFAESSDNLVSVDFSFNKLSEVSENFLDIIGKSGNGELFLQSNAIEKITPGSSAIESSRNFKTLYLSSNKLKEFVYNCTSIKSLTLNRNELDTFEIGDCSVKSLNLNDNNLASLKMSGLNKLRISNNVNLRDLNVTVDGLTVLEMKNLPARLMAYETLKNATKLTIFDAANTFLGQLKIDTLADMTSLQYLNLSNTGLSHIEYGMFSHQKLVTALDISGNNLGSLDINMLAGMKSLETLGIGGNNLTSLDHVDDIKNIFSELDEINIDNNHWNCTFLAYLLKTFGKNSITVLQPPTPVKDSPNVLGLKCTTAAQSKIQPVNADQANETIINKLNELIAQINEEKSKRDNHKFDLDVIKSEMFSMQKEVLGIKTNMVKSQLDLKGENSSNNSLDMNAVKSMVEQLNNFTLERQKIAYDQLVNKMSELRIENKVLGVEVDRLKGTHPPVMATPIDHESINFQHLQHPSQNDIHNGSKTTEVLLIILITSLVIVAIFFGYTKLKKSQELYSRNLMGVRARSTNTINTTIELPFGDGNH
jgi:Leucine-rich repeat (LRR) protein